MEYTFSKVRKIDFEGTPMKDHLRLNVQDRFSWTKFSERWPQRMDTILIGERNWHIFYVGETEK